jgi:hypothetical protein
MDLVMQSQIRKYEFHYLAELKNNQVPGLYPLGKDYIAGQFYLDVLVKSTQVLGYTCSKIKLLNFIIFHITPHIVLEMKFQLRTHVLNLRSYLA